MGTRDFQYVVCILQTGMFDGDTVEIMPKYSSGYTCSEDDQAARDDRDKDGVMGKVNAILGTDENGTSGGEEWGFWPPSPPSPWVRPDEGSSDRGDETPAGVTCKANKDWDLSSTFEIKSFLRCNGFDYGCCFDDKVEYTFIAVITGFQETEGLEPTQNVDDATKEVMWGYGSEPDVVLFDSFPGISFPDFDLEGVWNSNDDDAEDAMPESDLWDLSLGDLGDIFEQGGDAETNSPHTDIGGMFEGLFDGITGSRKEKEQGAAEFLELIPGWGNGCAPVCGGGGGKEDEAGADVDTLRDQCDNLGLDNSGSWPNLWERLRDHAVEDGRDRCPKLATIIDANPANKRRTCELIAGCLGIACDLNVNVPEPKSDTCQGVTYKGVLCDNEHDGPCDCDPGPCCAGEDILQVRAVAWIRAPADKDKCPDVGTTLEVGMEYNGITFKADFDRNSIQDFETKVWLWVAPPKLDINTCPGVLCDNKQDGPCDCDAGPCCQESKYAIAIKLGPASNSCIGVLCDSVQDGPCSCDAGKCCPPVGQRQLSYAVCKADGTGCFWETTMLDHFTLTFADNCDDDDLFNLNGFKQSLADFDVSDLSLGATLQQLATEGREDLATTVQVLSTRAKDIVEELAGTLGLPELSYPPSGDWLQEIFDPITFKISGDYSFPTLREAFFAPPDIPVPLGPVTLWVGFGIDGFIQLSIIVETELITLTVTPWFQPAVGSSAYMRASLGIGPFKVGLMLRAVVMHISVPAFVTTSFSKFPLQICTGTT